MEGIKSFSLTNEQFDVLLSNELIVPIESQQKGSVETIVALSRGNAKCRKQLGLGTEQIGRAE